MEIKEKDYFVAIRDEKQKDFIVYATDPYKLSELDLLNLIKICIIEGRAKGIGRKLLDVYNDILEREGTEKEKLEGLRKLEMMGIKHNGKREPTKSGKSRER